MASGLQRFSNKSWLYCWRCTGNLQNSTTVVHSKGRELRWIAKSYAGSTWMSVIAVAGTRYLLTTNADRVSKRGTRKNVGHVRSGLGGKCTLSTRQGAGRRRPHLPVMWYRREGVPCMARQGACMHVTAPLSKVAAPTNWARRDHVCKRRHWCREGPHMSQRCL